MPLLTNPRHEAFAQAMAEGKLESQWQCAQVAGFKGNERTLSVTASRLMSDANVLTRIDELRIIIGAHAAKAAGVSKAWVIENLKENVERAMQHVEVRDKEGNPTGEYQYEGSVANRALELIGKELGMFVDRKILTVDELRKIPEAELMSLIAQMEDEPAPESVH